jgi:hypothetical protein
MLLETRADYEALRRDGHVALHLGDSARRRGSPMTAFLIWVPDFIGSPLPLRVRYRLPDCAATAQGQIARIIATCSSVRLA